MTAAWITMRNQATERQRSRPGMPAPRLGFVNISHPDEINSQSNKRKVHQHVMQGIGLSRRNKARGRSRAALTSSHLQPEPGRQAEGGEARKAQDARDPKGQIVGVLVPAPGIDGLLSFSSHARAQEMSNFCTCSAVSETSAGCLAQRSIAS